MISFWEQNSFTQFDVIVIGSGIVGLSTACSLLEKNPSLRVAVLERGIFPSGASTKNAGFACFVKACEMLSDMKVQSEEETVKLALERYEGLQLLRKRLGDKTIDFLQLGGNELIFEKDNFDLGKIEYLNELLKPVFSQRVFEVQDKKIAEYGFANVKHLVFTPLEGQIDTGKMMRALLLKAQQLGAMVISGCEIKEISESGDGISCLARHAVLNENIKFKAQKVAVCANALATHFFSGEDLKPGRGQVLVTKPIKNLPFRGTFHFDEGFYYFRNYGERILFGGGRNLDIHGENTHRFEYNQTILDKLELLLKEVILPDHPFEIEMTWTGIMGFSSDKKPLIKQVRDNVVLGFSCNGMGVALGSLSGEKIAEAVHSSL